jgi:hypothetical protein
VTPVVGSCCRCCCDNCVRGTWSMEPRIAKCPSAQLVFISFLLRGYCPDSRDPDTITYYIFFSKSLDSNPKNNIFHFLGYTSTRYFPAAQLQITDCIPPLKSRVVNKLYFIFYLGQELILPTPPPPCENKTRLALRPFVVVVYFAFDISY